MIADSIGLTSYNSIETVIGLLASPFAWLLGIPYQDIFIAGELLGKKVILNEFVAYADLGKYLSGGVIGANGEPVELAMRSRIILSYALCGFANLGSIGIQLGGIGGIAPNRRGDLAKLAFRALVAGSFACFLTANIAGILID
jgi:CNT family concentrative nucleoside transporter